LRRRNNSFRRAIWELEDLDLGLQALKSLLGSENIFRGRSAVKTPKRMQLVDWDPYLSSSEQRTRSKGWRTNFLHFQR
jgi:hypothetical protein